MREASWKVMPTSRVLREEVKHPTVLARPTEEWTWRSAEGWVLRESRGGQTV